MPLSLQIKLPRGRSRLPRSRSCSSNRSTYSQKSSVSQMGLNLESPSSRCSRSVSSKRSASSRRSRSKNKTNRTINEQMAIFTNKVQSLRDKSTNSVPKNAAIKLVDRFRSLKRRKECAGENESEDARDDHSVTLGRDFEENLLDGVRDMMAPSVEDQMMIGMIESIESVPTLNEEVHTLKTVETQETYLDPRIKRMIKFAIPAWRIFDEVCETAARCSKYMGMGCFTLQDFGTDVIFPASVDGGPESSESAYRYSVDCGVGSGDAGASAKSGIDASISASISIDADDRYARGVEDENGSGNVIELLPSSVVAGAGVDVGRVAVSEAVAENHVGDGESAGRETGFGSTKSGAVLSAVGSPDPLEHDASVSFYDVTTIDALDRLESSVSEEFFHC